MGIINCAECGQVCMATPSKRCPGCRQIIVQHEEKVLEYLENQPNSTLDAIHAATDAPRHIIMQMIKAGRLEPYSVAYPCEGCRHLITRGRLCARCAENLTSPAPAARAPIDPRANMSRVPYREATGASLPPLTPRSPTKELK